MIFKKCEKNIYFFCLKKWECLLNGGKEEFSMDMYLLFVICLVIVIVVLGVFWWKWYVFISLIVVSLFLVIMLGFLMDKIVGVYEIGVGSVLGYFVGILVFGMILGKMMLDLGVGM